MLWWRAALAGAPWVRRAMMWNLPHKATAATAPAVIRLSHKARAATLAAAWNPAPVRLFDPVSMRLTRLARRERAQLLVESPERAPLQAFLTRWEAELYRLRAARDLRWHLDVDPLEV